MLVKGRMQLATTGLPFRQRRFGRVAGACLAVAAALTTFPSAAREAVSREPGTVALAELTPEAQAIHRAVHAGGPFAYAKDGTIFFNREGQLPAARRGHYREYTVPTPGAADRGARRIVCGGRIPTAPQACWYTADHYVSFTRIAP